MFKRYIDHEKKNLTENTRIFSKRNYTVDNSKLIAIVIACLSVIVFTSYFITDSAGFKIISIVSLLVFVGLLSWFTVLIKTINELIMTTELQNLIYATAARSSSWFCIIVGDDGSDVYFDKGFHDFFIKNANGAKKPTDVDYLLDHPICPKNLSIPDLVDLNEEKIIDVNHPNFENAQILFEPLKISFSDPNQIQKKYLIIKGIKKKTQP